MSDHRMPIRSRALTEQLREIRIDEMNNRHGMPPRPFAPESCALRLCRVCSHWSSYGSVVCTRCRSTL